MQNHIGKSSIISAANPLLDTFVVNGAGFLATPYALAFAIHDVSDASKQNSPVTIVPRTSVNLVTGKIGPGHFAPTWSVGSPNNGKHLIEWFMTIEEDGPEISWVRSFDVVWSNAIVPKGTHLYASISDVRCEGVGPMVTDLRILQMIAECSRRLEMWTRRVFVPEYKTLSLDAESLKAIYLQEAIVGIEALGVIDPTFTYDPTSYAVYNRHLRENLIAPDDRESPRLEFRSADSLYGLTNLEYLMPSMISAATYNSTTRVTNRKSSQRLTLSGVFGYTEYDGSPEGQTPADAKKVVVLMVLRDIFPATSEQSQSIKDRSFITSMRTREQSITIGRPGLTVTSKGARPMNYTGDPNIDSLIQPLCKSGYVAVV